MFIDKVNSATSRIFTYTRNLITMVVLWKFVWLLHVLLLLHTIWYYLRLFHFTFIVTQFSSLKYILRNSRRLHITFDVVKSCKMAGSSTSKHRYVMQTATCADWYYFILFDTTTFDAVIKSWEMSGSSTWKIPGSSTCKHRYRMQTAQSARFVSGCPDSMCVSMKRVRIRCVSLSAWKAHERPRSVLSGG